MIVSSEDCPNAVKPSNINGKTRRMQFIGLDKGPLNITNEVQLLFQLIIVPIQRARNGALFDFATGCPYRGLFPSKTRRALFHKMRHALFKVF